MQIVAHPHTILHNELTESLLISYSYGHVEATFSLVCDYWNKPQGSDRAFLRLAFSGIWSYWRERGEHKELQGFVADYSTKLIPGATVIQSVTVETQQAGSTLVELWFGLSFGGVSFAFESIVGHVRGARVQSRGDEYDYFDSETGARFNFYTPFD